MTTIRFAGSGVSIADIAAVARTQVQVAADERVIARLVEARLVLERVAAYGQPIYGMNTGLGANLKTAVTDQFAAFQLQLIRGRGMAVGEPMSRDVVRAVIAARLAMLAVGGSGISPGVFEALLALLNASVHPVMRSVGSVGAGDLVLLSAIARVLVGEGEAEYQGEILPAATALAHAGLDPAILQPKDGIALLNASAVSVGEGLWCCTTSDGFSGGSERRQRSASKAWAAIRRSLRRPSRQRGRHLARSKKPARWKTCCRAPRFMKARRRSRTP
jgi:histidine ammonia-lyase